MLITQKNNFLNFNFDANASTDFSLGVNKENQIELAVGTNVTEYGEPAVAIIDAVAQIGNQYFNTLVNAVKAAKSGDVIVLLKSSSGDGFIVDTNEKSITIDFNNNSYKIVGKTVGSVGTETSGIQLLKGGSFTLKNGTLYHDKDKILVQNYCDLVLDNFTLDGRAGTNVCQYTSSNNFGSTIIKNNSKIIAHKQGIAFDLWYGLLPSYLDGVNVSVIQSTIIGNVEYGAARPEEGWIEKTKLILENTDVEGALIPSSSNFEIADANIHVIGGTQSSNTWDLFR